jgi:hypothetical protein
MVQHKAQSQYDVLCFTLIETFERASLDHWASRSTIKPRSTYVNYPTVSSYEVIIAAGSGKINGPIVLQ